MKVVAFVPARGGSKRIPRKNVMLFSGEPLIYWTIKAAQAADLPVYVSTDDHSIAHYAATLGAMVIDRPAEMATDQSPDIEWVKHAIGVTDCDVFAILRPTSPFRTADTIKLAMQRFFDVQPHSLRAVEAVKQHPYKMWRITQDKSSPTMWMEPFVDQSLDEVPVHSRPTQTLPHVYVQNASLEIAWTGMVMDTGTISGTKILPFFTEGYEGFDLNTPEDLMLAGAILASGLVTMPRYEVKV